MTRGLLIVFSSMVATGSGYATNSIVTAQNSAGMGISAQTQPPVPESFVILDMGVGASPKKVTNSGWILADSYAGELRISPCCSQIFSAGDVIDINDFGTAIGEAYGNFPGSVDGAAVWPRGGPLAPDVVEPIGGIGDVYTHIDDAGWIYGRTEEINIIVKYDWAENPAPDGSTLSIEERFTRSFRTHEIFGTELLAFQYRLYRDYYDWSSSKPEDFVQRELLQETGQSLSIRGVTNNGDYFGSIRPANSGSEPMINGKPIALDFEILAMSEYGALIGQEISGGIVSWKIRDPLSGSVTIETSTYRGDLFMVDVASYPNNQHRIVGSHLWERVPELDPVSGEYTGRMTNDYARYEWDALIPAISGWSDLEASSISDDGRLIVGTGLKDGDDRRGFLMMEAGLFTDLDRDGRIAPDGGDHTTIDNPFHYWINDDNDKNAAKGDDIPSKIGFPADYANTRVDSVRDLVDFFPVYLDIKDFLAFFPESLAVTLKLKHVDGALNFVYTDLGREDALDFHTNLLTSGFGPRLNEEPGSAETHHITNEGVELFADFVSGIRNGDLGVILLEGRAATTNPLVLEAEINGQPIAEIAVELHLSPVEDMFRHVDLTDVPTEYDGTPTSPPEPAPPSRIGDPGDPWPDALTNGKYFVFLHGYRVDAESARGWQAEIFKRLHVLGSKARFVGVTWDGATGLDYHKAVFQAFQTGDVLADNLAFTNGSDVTVAAHSLGNMVVSHAIQDGGFVPSRYYMINAAVPIEAYDSSGVDAAQAEAMVEDDWKQIDPVFYAANWSQLFSSTPGDQRSRLSWKDRFDKIRLAIEAHNFYSSGEDVMENPRSSSSNIIWDMLINWNARRGAWGHQEFVKGASALSSFGGSLAFERVQAGWGANYTDIPDPSDPGVLELLKTEPLFRPFLENDLRHADPALASMMAEGREVQYDLLARALPALSFAAAANEILALGANNNFNMEEDGRMSMQWPTEGHADPEAQGRWLHGDFKNVALPYLFKMYQAMIEKGALQ